jgi:hypothetical protein
MTPAAQAPAAAQAPRLQHECTCYNLGEHNTCTHKRSHCYKCLYWQKAWGDVPKALTEARALQQTKRQRPRRQRKWSE